jgi:hypothetical protein
LAYFNKSLDIDPAYTDALMEAGFTARYTLNLFSEAFYIIPLLADSRSCKGLSSFLVINEFKAISFIKDFSWPCAFCSNRRYCIPQVAANID